LTRTLFEMIRTAITTILSSNLYSVYPKWLVAISVAAKVVNAIDPRREHRQFTLHKKRQEHQFKYQFE
jgi:hypothetical protein